MVREVYTCSKIKDEINSMYNNGSLLFSYCQSYIWIEALEKFSTGSILKKMHLGKLIYFLVYQDNNLKIIAPLLIKNKFAYLLGYKAPCNYKNFIYSEKAGYNDFVELFNYLQCNYGIIEIICDRVFDYDDRWFNILDNDKSNIYLLKSREKYNVQLNYNFKSFDEYFSSLSKSTRQNYRTAINRLTKDNLSYSFIFSNDPANMKLNNSITLKDMFLREHHKRVLKRYYRENINNNKIIFTIKRLIRFIVYHDSVKDTINDFCDKYYMESHDKNQILACLLIDQKPAAFCYGLISENGQRCNLHRVCIDEDKYKKYSPGMILLINFIKKYSEQFSIFDFTCGQEDYKFKLGCTINEIRGIDIVLNPNKVLDSSVCTKRRESMEGGGH